MFTITKKTTSDFLGGSSNNISQFSQFSTEQFSKVNSKYERAKEPVNMGSMLSRDEQKTLLSLEVQLPKNPLQKALDQYGYIKHNPELDFNVQELKAKISPHRADRCVIGFDRVLPREYRNSIYSVNRNIAESAVVDKDKSLMGIERLSTTRHDARPMQFKYEQEVLVSDLDNS